MEKNKLFWIGLVICSFVLLLAVTITSNQSNNSVVGAQTLPITPEISPSGKGGEPAIPPNISATNSSNPIPATVEPGPAYIKPSIQSTDPRMVTFTKDEIKQHLLKYQQWSAIISLKPQTILDIELTTSGQASKQLGDISLGLPDAAPVYIIKISGSFSVPAPPIPKSDTPIQTTSIAHKVFDAHTGYLLLKELADPTINDANSYTV